MNKSTVATLALYVVVFVSGAVLMGFEITGSNMLAPYFGSSVYTWGSVIGLFLGALSLGYLLGGHFADRRPNFNLLCILVTLSGLAVSLVPLVTAPVGNWLVRQDDLSTKWSPLVASLILSKGGPGEPGRVYVRRPNTAKMAQPGSGHHHHRNTDFILPDVVRLRYLVQFPNVAS